MKIALFISSLQNGGAERVMSNMANYWSAKDFDIDLYTYDPPGTKPFYQLNQSVNYIPLNLQTLSINRAMAYFENMKRIMGIRRTIKQSKPDVIISFLDMTNIFVLASTRGLGIPVIVSERSNPFILSPGNKWDWIRHKIYPYANAVVVQSKYIQTYFHENLHKIIHVIPNPVINPTNISTSEYSLKQPSIVSVGRLAKEKAFDKLIRAFSSVAKKYDNINLTIFGDGDSRTELESLIHELQLDQRVFLPGRVNHVHAAIQHGEMFVLTSKFEGFPNALCEAMAVGLPVVATECPGGVHDIIREGIDGFIVAKDDEQALADKMMHLIENDELRLEMSNNCRTITERYKESKIMDMWESLIATALNQ
jgi:glycosyltransferase involved in cell wall biosynthesis